jgi:hypothetical protein
MLTQFRITLAWPEAIVGGPSPQFVAFVELQDQFPPEGF